MRALPLAALLVLTFPLAAADWHSVADQWAEPSTPSDMQDGYMWPAAYRGPGERVYFNAFLSPAATGGVQPVGVFHAYLGLWKDCDGDGYIGSGFTGTETYSTALLPSPTVCPPGGSHNDGTTVREFRWIGPGSTDVADADAQVWADLARPFDDLTPATKTAPDAQLGYWEGGAGARWASAMPLTTAGASGYTTAYAHVGSATLTAGGQLPGAQGAYGAEACGPSTTGVHFGWDCNAADWFGPVKVHQAFELRDIDCAVPFPQFMACG